MDFIIYLYVLEVDLLIGDYFYECEDYCYIFKWIWKYIREKGLEGMNF